jgi:hypothetical protein
LTKLPGTPEKSGIQPRSPSHRASHHRYVHPTTKTSAFPTSKDPFISQNYLPNLNPTSRSFSSNTQPISPSLIPSHFLSTSPPILTY